tara:strand:+ start:96 stop:1532 length:1437 start_codon:yes stop_codon:yes gene_type:complete
MPLNHYERKLYELLKGLTEQDPEGGEGGRINMDDPVMQKTGWWKDNEDLTVGGVLKQGEKHPAYQDARDIVAKEKGGESDEKPEPKQTKIAANPFDDKDDAGAQDDDKPKVDKPKPSEPAGEPEIGSDEYDAKQEREAEKHNDNVMQNDPPHPGMSGDWDDAEEINMNSDDAMYKLAAIAKGREHGRDAPVSELRGMVNGLLATRGIRKFDKNNFATDDGRVLSQSSLNSVIKDTAEKQGYPLSDEEVSNLMGALENQDGSRPDKPEEVEGPETFDTLIKKSKDEPGFFEDEANVEKWNELTTQEDPPPDNATFGPNDPTEWDRARDVADSDQAVDAEHFRDFMVGGVKPEDLDRDQLRQDVTATLMRRGGIYPNEKGQWATDDGRILSKSSLASIIADKMGGEMQEKDAKYLMHLASDGEPQGEETEYSSDKEFELQMAKADREEEEDRKARMGEESSGRQPFREQYNRLFESLGRI